MKKIEILSYSFKDSYPRGFASKIVIIIKEQDKKKKEKIEILENPKISDFNLFLSWSLSSVLCSLAQGSQKSDITIKIINSHFHRILDCVSHLPRVSKIKRKFAKVAKKHSLNWEFREEYQLLNVIANFEKKLYNNLIEKKLYKNLKLLKT